MNKAAQALGRLAKGKRKVYSPEEIAIRTERIKAARKQFLAREAEAKQQNK